MKKFTILAGTALLAAAGIAMAQPGGARFDRSADISRQQAIDWAYNILENGVNPPLWLVLGFALLLVTLLGLFGSSQVAALGSIAAMLGGIVSPPDAISATTIMRNVNAPRSLVSIAEGESLMNDASSLIRSMR